MPYVDSNVVGGLDDGSSWANAWSSIYDMTGLVAGDVVFIASDHSETIATATALTNTIIPGGATSVDNPVQFISALNPGDTPTAGASISWTADFLSASCWGGTDLGWSANWWGMTLTFDVQRTTWTMENSDSSAAINVFDNCTLDFGASGGDRWALTGTDGTAFHFMDCSINFSGSSIELRNENVHADFVGCTFSTTGAGIPNICELRNGRTSFMGCDFSGVDTGTPIVVFTGSEHDRHKMFYNLLASGATLYTGTPAADGGVAIELTESATGSDPSIHKEHVFRTGTVVTSASIYRNGGAIDDVRANPFGFVVTGDEALTQIQYRPLRSQWYSLWSPGDGTTSYTYTLYINSDGNGESSGDFSTRQLWMECLAPNSAANNSLGEFLTTQPLPNAAATAITTDGSSTWTGLTSSSPQEIAISHTPDRPGPLLWRICFAPGDPGATDVDRIVYIDPKIYIT